MLCISSIPLYIICISSIPYSVSHQYLFLEITDTVIWFWIVVVLWIVLFILATAVYSMTYCITYNRVVISDQFLNGTKELSVLPLRAAIALSVVRILYYLSVQYGAHKLASRACAETAIIMSSINQCWQLLAATLYSLFYAICLLTSKRIISNLIETCFFFSLKKLISFS